MNDIVIPLYVSQPVLQTEFRSNADGCGLHVFTQLKRNGNICLYRRTRVSDGTLHSFEVINSRATNSATTDSYPEASTFGTRGWSYKTEDAAEERFKKCVQQELQKIAVPVNTVLPQAQPAVTSAVVVSGNSVVSTTNIVPVGEFTQADFARANGLPERGSVYNVIQKMISGGNIKVSRREKRGPGRETVLYVAA